MPSLVKMSTYIMAVYLFSNRLLVGIAESKIRRRYRNRPALSRTVIIDFCNDSISEFSWHVGYIVRMFVILVSSPLLVHGPWLYPAC